MKKLFSAFAIMSAVAIFATSCKDEGKEVDNPKDIPVTEIKVTPSPASVVAGTTLELKAQVLPEDATDKTVTWESRNESIATIDKTTGVVTGVAVGEVQVYAITKNRITGFCTITVTAAPIRVESVSIGEDFTLFVGKNKQLTATITPANATDQNVVWESSNKDAATVDETGKVVAVGAGEATITATVDEKVGSCKVTVSIPDIAGITMPYMDAIQGNTVKMTAAGFKAGDKVKLEAVAGEAYTANVDVANVTAADATFDLPAAASRDRSYKITVMRGTEAKAIAYLHPDNKFIAIPFAIGYYLTGDNEVVDNIDGMRGNDQGVIRRGYMKGSIVDYNEDTKEFRVWLADAKLSPMTFPEGKFDFCYATDVTSLALLKGLDFSAVTSVWVANSNLTELDMTLFPNAKSLYAWGDRGSNLDKIATVNFGTYKDDASALKLEQVQLERQSITGTIDLRNCIYLSSAIFDDNQIEKFNLGSATGDTNKDKDRVLKLDQLSAKRNKIKEIDLTNCARLRRLFLEGNKIERINLQNNARGLCAGETQLPEWMPYFYIIKSPSCLSIDWATEADAEGRERHINVEQYWWRVFSSGNQTENTTLNIPNFEGGWVENGPVVKALAAGFKVTCWTYWQEGKGDDIPHIIDEHAAGGTPCAY